MKLRDATTDKDASRLAQRIQHRFAGRIETPFEVRLPDGDVWRLGDGAPEFAIEVKRPDALSAITRLDELRFTEAYINGGLDIEGGMWSVISTREALRDVHPLHYLWRRIAPFFSGQLRTNRRAITDHYEYANEFFLAFLDPSRSYSQAVFERDDEPLEVAQRRKLELAVQECNLKPGDRVLDVGGGWGTFVEYAGKQGIHVTALTLAKHSAQYLGELIERLQLPCEVEYVDFYEYSTEEPYDAIVILGVMEHLPDYHAVVRRFRHLLRPGGRVYLDASSFRGKYSKPTFISRYVFPGNHRYFCLHDFLSKVAETKLELLSVHNDRYSYYLTCRQWARNLEAARDEIVARWGEKLYRIFRLYLWGSAHAFYHQNMDAFRLVLERPGDGGTD